MGRLYKPQVNVMARKRGARDARAEACLWQHLRDHKLAGIGFQRQHAIGPYIVDFCATRQKVVIEVDRNVHRNQWSDDQCRTRYLEFLGYTVLHFSTIEVLEKIESVLQCISDQM